MSCALARSLISSPIYGNRSRQYKSEAAGRTIRYGFVVRSIERQQREMVMRSETDGASGDAATSGREEEDLLNETVFYEGSGSNAETIVSVVLGVVTLVYLPLTITSLGRRAWTSLKVTSKRLIFELDSPVAKRREEILWSDTASVETVPRCFNLWGDLVIKTKKGNLLQIVGIEKHEEIRNYIRGRIG